MTNMEVWWSYNKALLAISKNKNIVGEGIITDPFVLGLEPRTFALTCFANFFHGGTLIPVTHHLKG